MKLDIINVKRKYRKDQDQDQEITFKRKSSSIATSPRLQYYRECIRREITGKKFKTMKEAQEAFREASKNCSIEARMKEAARTETVIFTKIFHFDANIFEEGIEEEDYKRLEEEIERLKKECEEKGGQISFRTSKRTNYSRLDVICEKIAIANAPATSQQ